MSSELLIQVLLSLECERMWLSHYQVSVSGASNICAPLVVLRGIFSGATGAACTPNKGAIKSKAFNIINIICQLKLAMDQRK